MLKRTLYFGNPYYLSTRNEQLVVQNKTIDKTNSEPPKEKIIPIEDIGFLVIDHPQVMMSHVVTQKLIAQNVAIIHCDEKHLPSAMLLPFDAHQTQNERFRLQINVTEPLRKQLWKQTIEAKITNQAAALSMVTGNEGILPNLAANVKSGDGDNREAVAAKYYWSKIFAEHIPDFQRERFGEYPNSLLNYGYAILRAATARALVGAGLHCTIGINHHNRYNAFCLADDMMEPYRPFVDIQVAEMVMLEAPHFSKELAQAHKQRLLSVLSHDCDFGETKSPLMIGLQRSAISLLKALEGENRKLNFPNIMP
jgi:CRISP-associated protein Cas1